MHSPLQSYMTRNWESQLILVTATLPQYLNSCSLPTELRGFHKDTQLTTKCSWLNSLWSCFSNSAFSSGDFCKEFKASSPNSRFRVALIFSPGSTIPWQAKKYEYPHTSLGIAFFDWCVRYYSHLHHALDMRGSLYLWIKSKHTYPSKTGAG